MPEGAPSCRQSQYRIFGSHCPSTTLHIGISSHVVHIYAIKDSPKSIFDNHQAKVLAPICGIHLYGHILEFCNLMDIPHSIQIPADGLFTDTILGCKLFQRLFALYIVADNLSFIAPDTAIKTTAAVIALYLWVRPLRPFLTTFLDPQKKHFLIRLVIIFAKITKSIDYGGITPNVQPAKILNEYSAINIRHMVFPNDWESQPLWR